MRLLRLSGAGAAALVVGGLACAGPPGPEFQPNVPIELPEAEAVDAVVFLVGDAGAATLGTSPLLRRMRTEVEVWAESLELDSAVTVVFLGDNVYPVGVHDRDHPEFSRDSTLLWSQIHLVSGEQARARGATAVFVAGNHDWGNMLGEPGLRRIRNQEAQIDAARSQGISAYLMPEAGQPGPVVRDVRENVRMMFIDTHWFLQTVEEAPRFGFFEEMFLALEDAEDRHVIIAAHHPYGSAGPHGLLSPGAKALGLLWLLKKSGTLVQDLNSPIYAELLTGMETVFRRAEHKPLVFAGGHDHSLQVLDSRNPDDPATLLVSGAGSKLTELTESDFLRYAAELPGYMMLVFRANEAVDLYVIAGDPDRLSCPAEPEEDRVECMTEGAAAFETVYSERLARERSLPDTAAAPGPRRP
jgi:hypothetical protein